MLSSKLRGLAFATGSAIAVGGFAITAQVSALDALKAKPPRLPWDWNHPLGTYDHASIRRGYFVYKQVCAACHSMDYVRYRELIDVFFTKEEAIAEAAEMQILDGPEDNGDMVERPGGLLDRFPRPYYNGTAITERLQHPWPNDTDRRINEQKAKEANNGAYPPDLTFRVLVQGGGPTFGLSPRNPGADYIFWLLLSYFEEPPAGVTKDDFQAYNPYFKGGGVLGMAQQIFDEAIEYEDGTFASASQLAKDVTTFLKWSGEPELEMRHRLFLRGILMSGIAFVATWFIYRKSILMDKWGVFKLIKSKDLPKRRIK